MESTRTRKAWARSGKAWALPRFGEHPFGKVDCAVAAELDVELAKRELSQATRNNILIVLRSVLRFAKGRGYLDAMPGGMPRIKPVGQREIPMTTPLARFSSGWSRGRGMGWWR
jgi:hypothetical protein